MIRLLNYFSTTNSSNYKQYSNKNWIDVSPISDHIGSIGRRLRAKARKSKKSSIDSHQTSRRLDGKDTSIRN